MGQKTKYEMEQEKKYGPRFTGGDHLNPEDGFKYYLHKTMMANELHDGYGGYLMSNAVKGASGPSFGGIQFDVGSNNDGQKLLEKVLRNAVDSKGNPFLSDTEMKQLHRIYKPFYDVEKNGKITKKGMTDADRQFYNQIKPKLDAALSSPKGMELLNENYKMQLDKKVFKVEEVISNVKNEENRNFLEHSMQAKVFIADIGNQYGGNVNNVLKNFLEQTENDQGIKVDHGRLTKVRGGFDMDDLKSFRMNTPYGIKHSEDAKRRDENIERITAPTRQQNNQKSAELNTSSNNPADKIRALIQGFKNDADGTFAAKVLAENSDVVENFRVRQQEVVKESNQQQQEVVQNTLQIQEERSYSGRLFG